MKETILKINGGKSLFGTIVNQTSKNATLPIISASILAKGDVIIHDYPHISDVDNMLAILNKLGVNIIKKDKEIILNSDEMYNSELDCELCKTMRSSLFLLGSLLMKKKTMRLYLPGGCVIGERPIDIHIDSLKSLGVVVEEVDGGYNFDASNAHAGKVSLRLPSVGATENLIQFASILPGKTIIYNSAKEPEIEDLANFLNKMGAKILGAGTDKITIYGVASLKGTSYRPMGDRIVAGTIMGAVAICGGDVEIKNACPYQNEKFIKILRLLSCQIEVKNDIIHIVRNQDMKCNLDISTGYYPDFPTDLQSILLAISTFVQGNTMIRERIFENRFLIVREMEKLGANVTVIDPHTVSVVGGSEFSPNDVYATDLRGGAALVLLCLAINGESSVHNIHYIDRGYENIENIFSLLGADIRRI